MAQTDNEKELILGNKQLISLFFLVVAMCGAFFAFGYMIGRNSTKTALPAEGSAPPATAQTTEPPRDANAPADAAPAVGETQPPVTQTQPAQDTPPPALQAQPTPAAGPTTAPPPAAAPVAAAPAPAPVAATEPGAIYLQVTALRKTDADNLVRTLKEQNLPALTAESSKPDLLRVMVGPYKQMTQVADAKAKLKALGFANAFVQK
jgi:cell division septation protein DedD